MADLFAVRNLVATYAPGPAKPAFPRTAGFTPASRLAAYSDSAPAPAGNVHPFPAPSYQTQFSGSLSNALLAQLYSQQDPLGKLQDQPPSPAFNTLGQKAYRKTQEASIFSPVGVDIPPVGPHREDLPAVDFLV
ncbi:MAG: hypothetical protein OEY85_08890 [Rhodospirillales bacterium]|nr:hypothetical protein [Rhodospirillales bacterium]